MELKATITTKGHLFDGQGPAIIREKLTAAMYEATSFLETKVKENLPTEVDGISRGVGVFGDQGGLRGGIHGEVEKGTAIVKGIVAHQSAYGDVVERGRSAGKGMPPKGMLVRWMEVKLGMSSEEALKKEFIFRRSIGKKGFKGVHMFERAFNDNYDQLVEIFNYYGFEIAKAL